MLQNTLTTGAYAAPAKMRMFLTGVAVAVSMVLMLSEVYNLLKKQCKNSAAKKPIESIMSHEEEPLDLVFIEVGSTR